MSTHVVASALNVSDDDPSWGLEDTKYGSCVGCAQKLPKIETLSVSEQPTSVSTASICVLSPTPRMKLVGIVPHAPGSLSLTCRPTWKGSPVPAAPSPVVPIKRLSSDCSVKSTSTGEPDANVSDVIASVSWKPDKYGAPYGWSMN